MLELDQLTLRRGSRLLFRHLDACVEEGSLLRVSGANGSGKTSLLRLVAGLAHADAGRILWRSREIVSLRERYHAALLWHGHLAALNPRLDALENLRLLAACAGLAADRRSCSEALAEQGLAAWIGTPCAQLSQGQQRRVALSRLALGADRPLWLLDEPFAALDAAAASALAAQLDAHCARGGCVVLSEHHAPALASPQQQLHLGAAPA